jgi:hypothetical protein
MLRNFGRFSFALVVALSVSATSSAQAVPHKEKAKGNIDVSEMISTTDAAQEWHGTGLATHMGTYTQTGSHKISLVTGEIYDGVFTSVAADGSSVSGIFYGWFTPNADGSVDYTVTAIWLEGTGRFDGIFGIAEVTAHASGVTPGSTYEFVDEGYWLLP